MKNTQTHELALCGFETVQARAKIRPETITRFFFTEDRSKQFGALCSYMARQKKLYRLSDSDALRKLCGTEHHQGVVAMVEDTAPPFVTPEYIAAWSKSCARIAVLDRVGDDHNVGSIARSAAFFGWHALVIASDDESSRLSTSAYRVARGALDYIPVYQADTIPAFLKTCGSAILTIGTDHKANISLKEFARKKKLRLDSEALAVVLGNEEKGLPKETLHACSEKIRIPARGGIESLNVSQAAAVFFYELSR